MAPPQVGAAEDRPVPADVVAELGLRVERLAVEFWTEIAEG